MLSRTGLVTIESVASIVGTPLYVAGFHGYQVVTSRKWSRGDWAVHISHNQHVPRNLIKGDTEKRGTLGRNSDLLVATTIAKCPSFGLLVPVPAGVTIHTPEHELRALFGVVPMAFPLKSVCQHQTERVESHKPICLRRNWRLEKRMTWPTCTVEVLESIHGLRVNLCSDQDVAGKHSVHAVLDTVGLSPAAPILDSNGFRVSYSDARVRGHPLWHPFSKPGVRELLNSFRRCTLQGVVYGPKLYKDYYYGTKGQLGFMATDLFIDGVLQPSYVCRSLCSEFGVRMPHVLATVSYENQCGNCQSIEHLSYGATTEGGNFVRRGILLKPKLEHESATGSACASEYEILNWEFELRRRACDRVRYW